MSESVRREGRAFVASPWANWGLAAGLAFCAAAWTALALLLVRA